MRFLLLPLCLSGILFCQCKLKPDDPNPVSRSLEYQSWESTAQPEGSAAYLGLGPNAKCLCTAVFESERQPEEAFHNSNGLLLDAQYVPHVQYSIDFDKKQAKVWMGDSLSRSARYYGDQGCILDDPDGLHFTPQQVVSSLPDAASMDWPMGDRNSLNTVGYDAQKLSAIAELAFDTSAITAAFLVVHKGKILIERYRDGINRETQLESWSMGKSLTAALIGRLIHMGHLSLDQKAPVAEWQREGDPRAEITIRNLLQMSSGLRFPSYGRTRTERVAGSGSYDAELPIAQLTHVYPYTGSVNVFEFAVNRPLEFIPGSKGSGQYRNCDPLTLGYILRQIVEAEGQNYLTWPQEELFDKIGVRRQLLETDRWGNFILTGYDYGTARNWARLALLFLNDGIVDGDRILPEAYSTFVSTPAEGWEDPIYGGLFWINTDGAYKLPKDAYAMRGGGGQNVIIVPSLDLVVVRLGHGRGAAHAMASLNRALEALVPVLQAAN